MREFYYHPKKVLNQNYKGKKDAYTRCTVAAKFDDQTQVLTLSFVALSNKDKVFCKAKGRKMAMGRVDKAIKDGELAVGFPVRLIDELAECTTAMFLAEARHFLTMNGYVVERAEQNTVSEVVTVSPAY